MTRLTTAAQKRHNEAMSRLQTDAPLSEEDIEYIFEHFHEGANHLNGLAGAFFTPAGLARDFSIEVQGERIIDLCAGIGALSYPLRQRDLTCVEFNADYVAVGRRLLPNAAWIHRDVTEMNELPDSKKFDVAISNPPFGNIGGIGMFDLEVVRLASQVAKTGVFILPQLSTPFRYSGEQSFRTEISDKLQRWMDKTQIEFTFNCGIDCNTYIDEWKGVKPVVEIVCCEFM